MNDKFCIIVQEWVKDHPRAIMGPYDSRTEAHKAQERVDRRKYYTNVTRMDTEAPS